MYSKAKIGGHPLHPMLVAFPIAFYTSTVVCFIIAAANHSLFVFRMGVVANIAGVAMAFLAALPGFIDWAAGIPSNTRAKRDGLTHMALNVIALVLFVISAAVAGRQWDYAYRSVASPLVLSIIGMIITLVAASIGWVLVQSHHVGVQLTPEQERLDPNQPVPVGTEGPLPAT